MGVFAKPEYLEAAYPYKYEGRIEVPTIAGGTPSDPNVMEGFIRSKVAEDRDDLIREAVAEMMVERNIDIEAATKLVGNLKALNGFKKDDDGLYIEGRQLKAALREAAMVCRNAKKLKDRWGDTKKGLSSWLVEHLFVVEDRLHLGATEPSDIAQRFIENKRVGTRAIQYNEIVHDALVDFTVITDHDFEEKEWALLWLTAEQLGIGAGRSHGYGRFELVKWEQVK